MSDQSHLDVMQLCHDIVGVLRDKRDFHALSHCVEQSNSINCISDSDFNNSLVSISDYERKIDDCKQKIEVARSEAVPNEEIERIKIELDEELKREQSLREDLRVIVDKINELDQQRLLFEEQNDRLKEKEEEEKEKEKEQRKLSFYASVTKIIPNLENQSKISGHIVEHDRKAVQSFEFCPLQENAFDICNKTWRMINP